MTPDQTAAVNLKALRTSRGLTQAGLADQLGTSCQTVSAIERGARKPTLQWWASAATRLKVRGSKLHPELR